MDIESLNKQSIDSDKSESKYDGRFVTREFLPDRAASNSKSPYAQKSTSRVRIGRNNRPKNRTLNDQ
jgi:hypothetical protein